MIRRNIHLEQAIYGSPWLATPGLYKAVVSVYEKHKVKVDMPDVSDLVNQRGEYEGLDENGIACIEISGVLGSGVTNIEKACGVTDYSDVGDEIDQAVADGANGIMFVIDSGGGMVNGCPELGQKIAGLNIPTQCYTPGMAASAAYWLASACDSIIASESAEVGSIGVIIPNIDESGAWQAQGVKWDPITNAGATQKGAFFGPTLTHDQRAGIQASVDKIGSKFHAAVQSKREVDPSVFDASMHSGDEAISANLIDATGSASDAYDNLYNMIQDNYGFGDTSDEDPDQNGTNDFN